jgi:hypothetical protein
LTGIARVAEGEDADLILDIARAPGDLSGRGMSWRGIWSGPRCKPSSINGVALEKLKFERLGDRLTMRVLPNDGTHRQGQEMAFEIDDIRLPYLVFFSLSGDGTLNFHYPLPEDPETVPTGRPVRVGFKVTPPYGADHIIAVASDQSLGELTALLRSLDGKPAPRPALESVIAVLRQGSRQLGIQGLYTAP